MLLLLGWFLECIFILFSLSIRHYFLHTFIDDISTSYAGNYRFTIGEIKIVIVLLLRFILSNSVSVNTWSYSCFGRVWQLIFISGPYLAIYWYDMTPSLFANKLTELQWCSRRSFCPKWSKEIRRLSWATRFTIPGESAILHRRLNTTICLFRKCLPILENRFPKLLRRFCLFLIGFY